MLSSQMTCYQNTSGQAEPQKTTRFGVTYVSRDWNQYLDYNQTTLDSIKQHGFNIVRLALYWKAYNPEPGVYDKYAFDNLTSILSWASENQIQTVLEFHFSFYLNPDPTIPSWLGNEQDRSPENFLFNDKSLSAFIAYENYTIQAVKQYAANIVGVELNEPFFISNVTSPTQKTIVDLFRKWLENKYGSISLLNQTWSRQPLGQNEQNFDQVNFPVEKTWYSPRWVDYYTFIQERYMDITKSFEEVVTAYLPGSQVMVSYNEGIWWTGIFYTDENTQAVFPQKYLSTRGLHTYPSTFGNLNNTLNTLKIYFDTRLFSGYGGQTWITEAAAKHPAGADYQNVSSVLRIASLLLKAQPEMIIIWNAMTGQDDRFSIFYPDGEMRDFAKAWSWIARLQPKVSITNQPQVLVIMPTIGTPLWYNYFSSTYSTALALYESGVNFDIWVGPALPDTATLSKYKSVLVPVSTSFNETWAKTILRDYVSQGGSLFVGRGQQVDWNMKQTTPSADSFYYFSDEPTSEKSLEDIPNESISIASDFYDLKAGSVFNFTFHDAAYFPKAQEIGPTVVPIIKDSNGDTLAARTTYGNGKILFFGGWADFGQNIQDYILLVHSFLKWGGTVTAEHQLQNPNLLDSGWIELKSGAKLRIASNIGATTYNLDNQYAIAPGKILVLADQRSTFDGIADFMPSNPDLSFKVVAPDSIR